MIFLATERLVFRTHTAQDEAAFVEMQTDAEARRYVGGRAWTVDEARARFRAQFLGKPSRTYGMWAVVLRADDRYVGYCGLRGNRSAAHLAYYIARPFWQRGLGSESVAAFVHAAFDHLRLPRILASAEDGNRRSQRILEKLGFGAVRTEVLDNGRVICHYELRRQ